MGRPAVLLPAEDVDKLKRYILKHRDLNKEEIASEFDLDADFVYQVAYRMGVRLPRVKEKMSKEHAAAIEYARENSHLSVTEIARKLKKNPFWLRYLLRVNNVQVKMCEANPRKPRASKAIELFEHDELFWMSYREN
jgi:hypothetical protein